MLLTITYSALLGTDLGYLLHKSASRFSAGLMSFIRKRQPCE
jgi:hypothetical protein